MGYGVQPPPEVQLLPEHHSWRDPETFKAVVNKLPVPVWTPSDETIAASDTELKKQQGAGSSLAAAAGCCSSQCCAPAVLSTAAKRVFELISTAESAEQNTGRHGSNCSDSSQRQFEVRFIAVT